MILYHVRLNTYTFSRMLCGKRQEDRIGKFFELIFFSAWPPLSKGGLGRFPQQKCLRSSREFTFDFYLGLYLPISS